MSIIRQRFFLVSHILFSPPGWGDILPRAEIKVRLPFELEGILH
jgi:hypothetical protein